MGRGAHGLPTSHGRRSVAADVPARLAQRLQRSRPHDHEQRRLCGRRATKGAKGERLARRSSRCEHFNEPGIQRPGSGLGGCPGWRSGRASTERSDLRAGPIAKRASVMRSMTDEEARDPRARERAAACLSRLRRPDRVASGMDARQGRDAGIPVARRVARQPGPAQRGDAKAHRDLASTTPPHTPPQPPASTAPTIQTRETVDPVAASNIG